MASSFWRRNADLPQNTARGASISFRQSFHWINDFGYRIDERWQASQHWKAINCGQCYTPIHGTATVNANKFNSKITTMVRSSSMYNLNSFFISPIRLTSLLFWLTKIFYFFFFWFPFISFDSIYFSNAHTKWKEAFCRFVFDFVL